MGPSPAAAAAVAHHLPLPAVVQGVLAAVAKLGELVRGDDDPAGAGTKSRAAAVAVGGAAPGVAAAKVAAAAAASTAPPADVDKGDRHKAWGLLETDTAAGHPAANRTVAGELRPSDPAGAAGLLYADASATDVGTTATLAALYEHGAVLRGVAVVTGGRAGCGRRDAVFGGAAAAASSGVRAVAKDTFAVHQYCYKTAAPSSRASARRLTSQAWFGGGAGRARDVLERAFVKLTNKSSCVTTGGRWAGEAGVMV